MSGGRSPLEPLLRKPTPSSLDDQRYFTTNVLVPSLGAGTDGDGDDDCSPVESDISQIRDSHPAEVEDISPSALLLAQGHDMPMKKSFSLLAALSLGFSITNSWVGYLSCFRQNLAYAGPNNVVFGLLVSAAIQWIISLGLAEVASCFPCSGGQYHFAFILAPNRYKKPIAFFVGWMNLLGWSVALCSGISVVMASFSGMVSFWVHAFSPTQWQLYLLYLATATLSALPLFLGPRSIPSILKASMAFSIAGFLIFFGLVLALRKHSRPLSCITTPSPGTSGWGLGTAWTLGLGNSIYAFSGTDAVIHIAEEMPSPERQLPQAINLTMAIGLTTAFPLLSVMMLSMTDAESIVMSELPYAELFFQITESRAVTILFMIWVTIVLFSALIGQWITCGRLAWAFARDRGLPYSEYFGQINERLGFPVRATVLSFCFCSVYGLLYLISTTAFNSIITSAGLYLNITYAIPQALIAARGRKNILPEHSFNLGAFGYLCDFFSPILVSFIGVLICFPPQLPVTTANTNYTPLAFVILLSIIFIAWKMIGERFEGPKIRWEVLRNAKIV